MQTLRGLFSNGHSPPLLADKLEIAVSDVMRQAEELCCLLRMRREAVSLDVRSGSTDTKD